MVFVVRPTPLHRVAYTVIFAYRWLSPVHTLFVLYCPPHSSATPPPPFTPAVIATVAQCNRCSGAGSGAISGPGPTDSPAKIPAPSDSGRDIPLGGSASGYGRTGSYHGSVHIPRQTDLAEMNSEELASLATRSFRKLAEILYMYQVSLCLFPCLSLFLPLVLSPSASPSHCAHPHAYSQAYPYSVGPVHSPVCFWSSAPHPCIAWRVAYRSLSPMHTPVCFLLPAPHSSALFLSPSAPRSHSALPHAYSQAYPYSSPHTRKNKTGKGRIQRSPSSSPATSR